MSALRRITSPYSAPNAHHAPIQSASLESQIGNTPLLSFRNITSHLPHLIAYTIVGTAFDFEQQVQNDVIKYSASGFRDFTRIASSDPVMWRDVFINNSDAVLEMLGRFSEDLTYLQRAIRWKEADKLQDLFTKTRDIRAKIKDYGQLD